MAKISTHLPNDGSNKKKSSAGQLGFSNDKNFPPKTKKEKRILYIITKSVWGGAAKYVYDLANNFSNNFEVMVAAGGQRQLAQKIKGANIPYFEIKGFQKSVNIFKDILAGWDVFRLLLNTKPRIVHVNSSKAGGIVGLAGFFYKIISRRPFSLVFTVHGWAFNEERTKYQLFLIRFFSKITSLFYDKIICVSEYDRLMALRHKTAPANKLTTIYNGIDSKKTSFLPRDKAQKKLIGKRCYLVVGTIAEWTKNKGIIYLLEAATQIKQSKKEINFVLIGSGENPDKEKIKKYIKEKQLKNIHLIEWTYNAASYITAFDIFVLPSLKEGLPYTILEAMAGGAPVVASQVGGIPEIITNNKSGLLTEPKNSQQLAEKINYLLNNPKKGRQLTKNAKQKLEKEFSLETMINKTKHIYLLLK